MGYRFFDHTADLAVELTAATPGELCAEALAAFTEILTERERVAERTERRFALAAPGLDLLLVDWLGELLYAFEVEGLLFRRAEAEVEDEDGGVRLAATAWGEPRDESRHPLKVLVKAITYHGLQVTADAQGLKARVIFDI
jgi:SHS2 domain-containing protein